MNLMDPEKFFGCGNTSLDLTDLNAQINVEVHSDDFWVMIILQDDNQIVGMRNWLAEYCRRARIG